MMIELCYTPKAKYIRLTANAVEMRPERVKDHMRAIAAALAWLESEEKLNALDPQGRQQQDEEGKKPEG